MLDRRKLAMDYWKRIEEGNVAEISDIAREIALDKRLDSRGPLDLDRQNLLMKCNLNC